MNMARARRRWRQWRRWEHQVSRATGNHYAWTSGYVDFLEETLLYSVKIYYRRYPQVNRTDQSVKHHVRVNRKAVSSCRSTTVVQLTIE